MGWPIKHLFAAFLIAAAAIHEAQAYTMVTGTVFCDQCKDGQLSLFDYPLSGVTVAVTCADGDGEQRMMGEETTNSLGSYAMSFDGTADMSGCSAQVSGTGSGEGCGAAGGPARNLKLMFRMFDMEMYTIDPLLSQPAQPMSYCPTPANPVPAPITPVTRPPMPQLPPTPRLPPLPPVPPLPHMPHLPPIPPLPHMPPVPSVEASACGYRDWTMPEHRCYWKVVTPDTKVAVAFGLIAARRYGTDMTLGMGMQGRGDPYRTLLREATTALLNSYNSILFPYHPLAVVQDMNWALLGSTRHALLTALRFMRANSGNGSVTCRFTPCK